MNKQNSKAIYPILFGFFVMGFADVVGIATNYVKVDFSLSDTLANLIPMMVFLWFAGGISSAFSTVSAGFTVQHMPRPARCGRFAQGWQLLQRRH